MCRIKKCKDYYEILGVTKDATDEDVKKAYKKLALQLHPDKNRAPGSAEAFKAIGNAVAILTDVEKRKRYDLYGSSEERTSVRRTSSTHEYSRGFESDMTAEELFNMFFGTGFSSPQSHIFTRRNGRWHRAAEDSNHQQQNGSGVVMQLLPLLLLIVISMLSGFFITDPVYMLSHSSKYPITRHTARLHIPYFVKENFRNEYQGSLHRLESSVEEEYLSNLRQTCFREKNYRDTLIWKARQFGDQSLMNRAENMDMPACQEYTKLTKVH